MKIKTVFLDVIMHSLEDIYAQKQKTTKKNPKQTNKQTTTTTTTKHTHTHTHNKTQHNQDRCFSYQTGHYDIVYPKREHTIEDMIRMMENTSTFSCCDSSTPPQKKKKKSTEAWPTTRDIYVPAP